MGNMGHNPHCSDFIEYKRSRTPKIDIYESLK